MKTRNKRDAVKVKDLARGSILHREIPFTRADIDEDERTIRLAFSSEAPVDRMFFDEILDHDPGSARLDRLNNGAPLLVEHDRDRFVGVVEAGSAVIDGDRMGRAVVRFSSRAAGEDEWRDVRTGVRSKVSIGYRVHDWTEQRIGADEDERIVLRITDWEPLEVSLVSLAADDGVGVGRGLDIESPNEATETMNAKTKDETGTAPAAAAPEAAPTVPTPVARVATRDLAAEERARAGAILNVANQWPEINGIRDLAARAVSDGDTFEAFQAAAMPMLRARVTELENSDAPVTEIGLSKRETRSFSLVRALDGLAMQAENGTPMQRSAPFELECSLAIAEKLGREARGIFVPWEVQRSGWRIPPRDIRGQRMETRAAPMDTSENSHLVGTDHLSGSFVDALRARAVTMALGARVLSGLVGNVSIPRLDTPATWAALAEDGAVTAGEQVTGAITLSPKTIGGGISITRRLLKQSSPDVEQLVRDDLTRGAPIEVDRLVLTGSGTSNEPTGITDTSGIGTSTISTPGQPTWAELVEFEEDVATANALEGALGWVSTPAVRTHGKTTLKTSGVAGYLWEGGMVNDYPALASNQMDASDILFGNFDDVVIGFWGVLDVNFDPFTQAAKGGLNVWAFQDFDCALRHAGSFSKNA